LPFLFSDAGGLLWFELFSAEETRLQEYQEIIRGLQYKELYWQDRPRPQQEGKEVPVPDLCPGEDTANRGHTQRRPLQTQREGTTATAETETESGETEDIGRGTRHRGSTRGNADTEDTEEAKPRGSTRTSSETEGMDTDTSGTSKTTTEETQESRPRGGLQVHYRS